MKVAFQMLEDEYWWGGATPYGDRMPFTGHTSFELDLTGLHTVEGPRNQSMPLLLSSKGRYLWSDEAFSFSFQNGMIYAEGEKEIRLYQAGTTLKEAYIAAMRQHFPFDGAPLQEKFFCGAQYNTWMHTTYRPTQNAVLAYARKILESGFEPGILIIDEGWHGRYGTWEFDVARFPDAKAMVDELHALGFTVMLWVCPFVSPDGERYVKSLRMGAEFEDHTESEELYLRLENNGEVALIKWWNGTSAILDFTKEKDKQFMKRQLDRLVEEYGIDGFKFDGGQIYHYSGLLCVNGKPNSDHTHYERNRAWNEFGRQYRFHEYKDTHKGGGKCMIQRLLDRHHSWDKEGINTIIPYSLLQGLLGYPFICPDMIGGGEWTMLANGIEFDEELFVRMCQVSVFFPMMQFSLPPWEILNKDNLAICLKMTRLHKALFEEIVAEVNKSRFSGEPIVRHLAYEFPHDHLETVNDCFMFSDRYLVAPVLTKGAVTRTLKLPSGYDWKYVDGQIYRGDQTVTVDAPLEVLPYFEKKYQILPKSNHELSGIRKSSVK